MSTRRSASTRKRKSKPKQPKLSRTHQPENMSLEDWQIQLRRQFGREQNYGLVNRGHDPIFSEFEVKNPTSGRVYRVEIRGDRPGENRCTCADFATNTLGTCKHIEFTLARLERKRGAKTRFRNGFLPTHSEVFLQYGSQREIRFRPGTDCPKELARLAADYFDSDGTLRDDAFNRFEIFLNQARSLEPDLVCRDDALAFIAEQRDAAQRKLRVLEAFPKGERSAAFDGLLKTNLYDYQRQGVLFAAMSGRCLIGDEMGLGKTIQAIGAAEVMARLFGVERVLIVCPTSLKYQWAREIEKFTDRDSVIIGGLRPRRQKLYPQESFYKITNYDTIHSDLDLIDSWSPDLVILDEAQRIKNWETRTARNVKLINSPYAIVLTGTPLENRLEELISIVQFVDRYRMGPTFRLLHEHQHRDEAGKVIGYRELDRLGRTLEPVLLRRKKQEVLDQLPERIDHNYFVQMTQEQWVHHNENREIVARIVQKWHRYKFLSEADQRRLMIALQKMRMSCDSTYLLDPETDHGEKVGEACSLLAELFEDPAAKVVIFSQWLRMHELLSQEFQARGWGHVLFHGSVPSQKRGRLIDQFRDDPNCRAFLSTDAGGVGLNLQHSSAIVMNMDLPWNPAVLEQRIGRVHRLGQSRAVQVFNFVARGTIEEGMLSVLKFKKSLFAGVLDGGDAEVFLGGSKLKKFMESVEATTRAIPESSREDDDQRPERTTQGTAPMLIADTEDGTASETASGTTSGSMSDGDPWSGLVQSGMALLQQMAAARNGEASPLVHRDQKTGEQYLKLPVPKPEVLDQAVRAFGALLESMRQ